MWLDSHFFDPDAKPEIVKNMNKRAMLRSNKERERFISDLASYRGHALKIHVAGAKAI
jgi:hypothetical protein